jgi:eukaryotic-like serine/threonine-protein kinase
MNAKSDQALSPGLVLDGKFIIEDCLGEGGMGEVYRAKQVAVGRTVAVKVLHASLCTDPGLVARFRQEMHNTTVAEHPNIVRVYDVGHSAGRLYLAMEYLEGPSLRKVIGSEGRLPLDRAGNIAVQIANALGAAHSHGIVHRDLKPDNVMLLDVYGNREFVKVVDFGIARSLDDSRAHLTADGMILGTPGYLAPEQVLGRTADERTDLYALGTILFEMLSGQLPFHSTSNIGLMMARATTPPPPITDFVPTLPIRAADLIMSLLSSDPSGRPASAKEVVEALEGWPQVRTGSSSRARPQEPPIAVTAVLPEPGDQPVPATPPQAAIAPEPRVRSAIPTSPPTATVPEPRVRSAIPASPPTATLPEPQLQSAPPRSSPAATPHSLSSPPTTASGLAPKEGTSPTRVVTTRSGRSDQRALSTKTWVRPLLIIALVALVVLAAAIAGIIALLR